MKTALVSVGGRGALLRLVMLTLVVSAVGFCDAKRTAYFLTGAGGPVDDIAPVITFLTPTAAVLNSGSVCFRVTDNVGFDPADIVVSNLEELPVTPLVNVGEFGASTAALDEGDHELDVTVIDLGGNVGMGSINIGVDRTAPGIDNFTVPDDQSSSAPSLTLTFGWRISDANLFNTSHFELRDAGPDGQVGNGDDLAVPEGTGGGQADDPVQDVTCTNGDCIVEITIFNGVTMPGDSRTRTYYGRARAFDIAKANCGGEDNPNTADANSPPVVLVWRLDPPTTGTLTVTVQVGGQVQQGAQVQISGPGGTATATTDASGVARFENRQPGANSITTTLTNHVCPGATGNVVAGQTINVVVNCTAQPTDFTVTFNQPIDFYVHIGPGVSFVCGRGGTNPPQPGAAYTITWTGPGIVGSNTRNGTLDATGGFFDQQQINQFGTYTENVSVTSDDGVTRSGTASKTVAGAQGSCPPPTPSSSRFKRGIVGLLPHGVTVLGLRPVAFRYVEPYGDPAVTQIGLIAEHVVRLYPEAVALDADGRPEGIYYGVLTGRVIETLEARATRALEAGVARMAEALE